jgi:hypothetical protein
MDAGINNVIYMELHSGPKMANSTCGNHRLRFHCTVTKNTVALLVASKVAGLEVNARKVYK